MIFRLLWQRLRNYAQKHFMGKMGKHFELT
jgi:hypothetical protein